MGKPRERLSVSDRPGGPPDQPVRTGGSTGMAARRQPPIGGAPLRIPVDYLHGRQPPSGVLL
jgi:hypothetical protein